MTVLVYPKQHFSVYGIATSKQLVNGGQPSAYGTNSTPDSVASSFTRMRAYQEQTDCWANIWQIDIKNMLETACVDLPFTSSGSSEIICTEESVENPNFIMTSSKRSIFVR